MDKDVVHARGGFGGCLYKGHTPGMSKSSPSLDQVTPSHVDLGSDQDNRVRISLGVGGISDGEESVVERVLSLHVLQRTRVLRRVHKDKPIHPHRVRTHPRRQELPLGSRVEDLHLHTNPIHLDSSRESLLNRWVQIRMIRATSDDFPAPPSPNTPNRMLCIPRPETAVGK